MEYPLSEIIDRLSILILKGRRLPENTAVLAELQRFDHAFAEYPGELPVKEKWLSDLLAVNGKIWNLEADIRNGRECLNFERIGIDAIAIRNLNAERIRLKNAIAEAMGEFREIKVDHVSEQTPDPPRAA